MSSIQGLDTELIKIKNKLERLLLDELVNTPNNFCFYNEEIKVNRLDDEQLEKVIPYLNNKIYCISQKDSYGYSILLEHIPTGMVLEYIVFSESYFPRFQQNKYGYCILKVFKDNFIEDYLAIYDNLSLFSHLNTLVYEALMYQDFKEILEKNNEN